jgi:hypothetical protein
LIRSAENEDPLSLDDVELPLEPYPVADASDNELCSDCRNCCRMLSGEFALDELLVLLLDDVALDDELDDEAPP